MNNVTTATFTGSGRKAEACPLFQYDYGQILKIEGLELPPLYEVDFGNDRSSGTSITVLGDADGVEIPNQLLETGEYVFAWIVLHEGEDDRETEYMVEIPVIRRAEPSDEEPTPEQMTIIEQLTAEVAVLKGDIEQLDGLSDDVKTALLNCFAHVAWTDEHGQDYYDALEEALYEEEPKTLDSITAVYTQSDIIWSTDDLDVLKDNLVVTAHYSDSTTATITSGYTLSGSLTTGTSTITVSYSGKTATFTVTVTEGLTYGVYTPTTATSSYYIDATGAVVSATANSGYIEDYIPVVRDDYWIGYQNAAINHASGSSTAASSEANWRISEYNANKEFIKQTQYASTGTEANTQYCARVHTFDSNTKYMRIGWYNSKTTGTTGVFDIENPDTAYTELQMESGDIDGTTGQNKTGNSRARTTGYIEATGTISASQCPFYSTWSNFGPNAGYAFRCYDSNKAFVGSLTNSGQLFNADISDVALPAGTAYVRMFTQFNSANFTGFPWLVGFLMTINGTPYYLVG